jgi:hypothetical protein
MLTYVNVAEPSAISECVRIPTGFLCSFRLRPIALPHTTDKPKRSIRINHSAGMARYSNGERDCQIGGQPCCARRPRMTHEMTDKLRGA